MVDEYLQREIQRRVRHSRMVAVLLQVARKLIVQANLALQHISVLIDMLYTVPARSHIDKLVRFIFRDEHGNLRTPVCIGGNIEHLFGCILARASAAFCVDRPFIVIRRGF